MGVAWRAFRLGPMAKGEVHELFLHPFSGFVTFDVNAFKVGNQPGFEPAARLEVLGSYDHEDGKGYLLRITNISVEHGGNPRPTVDILAYNETLAS
jgi:hypothetical protein